MTSIVAVSMMRDEADIAADVIGHMFKQGCDEIIVGNHHSSDGTAFIAHAAGAIVVDLDPEGYWQSRFMTELTHKAGGLGADWVVPFDADEFWCAINPALTVRDVLERSPHDIEMATSFEQWQQWRAPQPKRLCKVAFRYRPGVRVAQGNHDVLGAGTSRGWTDLTIHEYQYRSFEQLSRKVRTGKAAYEATDLHHFEGAHWRELGALDDRALHEWWLNHLTELTVEEPGPWR